MYPIHNATLGIPLPGCNPSILSNQSALFQQEHISTVTEGGYTTSGAACREGRGGRKWVAAERKSVRTISMLWHGDFLDQQHVPLSLSIQVSERAVSCQYLPAADWRLLAVMLLMFLTVTFVTALPHSFSLLLCLSPILTSLLSHFFPKSPISSFCFSSLPFCSYPYFPPAQCSGERLPQQQGSSHESKPWLQLDPW